MGYNRTLAVVLAALVVLGGCRFREESTSEKSTADAENAGTLERQQTETQPDISLTATPPSVTPGEGTTLRWSASDAESCVASGDWGGDRPLSGSFDTGPINDSAAFSLSCTGAGGGALARVVVTAAEASDGGLEVQLKASPPGVDLNGATTLQWSTAAAGTCTASGDWSGDKPVSGSEQVTLGSEDQTYRLRCEGAGGSAVAITTVSVRVAQLSWAPPSSNVDGSELTDLDGYRIYWGETSRQYSNTAQIDDADTTAHSVPLPPGTYYFSITAFSSDGEESAYSNEVVRDVF